MIEFPLTILSVVGAAIAVSVIAMYHVISNVMRHEVTLHDLRNRVERLQNEYTVRLARMSGEIPPEFEVLVIDPETNEPESDQPASDHPPVGQPVDHATPELQINEPIEQPEPAIQAA